MARSSPFSPRTRQTRARALTTLALQKGTPVERRSLGFCYRNAFSNPSSSIHFEPLPGDGRELDFARLRFGVLQAGFLCAAILVRVEKLFGIVRETPACRFARRAIQGSAIPGISHTALVGDFVVVMLGGKQPFLAQVTEVVPSQYGNESYRVRYLDELPFLGLTVDSVPADRIAPYQKHADLRDELRKELAGITRDEGRVHLLDELTGEEIDESMRKAVTMVWTMAFRDIYKRQLEATLKK
jgi:hypothetical protein